MLFRLLRLVIVTTAISLAACAPVRTIEDLGVLPGGYGSGGLSINESGTVAGYSFTGADPHNGIKAFVHVVGLGMLTVPALPDGLDYSWGEGVSDSGAVVGGNIAVRYDAVVRAFMTTEIISPSPVVAEFGFVDNGYSYARDVNEAGLVTGEAETAEAEFHAFLWSEDQGMRDLGTLGGNESAGLALNRHGQVAGESRIDSGVNTRAFRFTEGVGLRDLGTLPGGASSRARGINDHGDVVGSSETDLILNPEFTLRRRAPSGVMGLSGVHAFLWTERDGMIDLGHLGGNHSTAEAINNNGMVVGQSAMQDGQQRAFAWTAAGGMIDLNDLLPPNSGWLLMVAYDVNDRGQITGVGLRNGHERAYRLTPPDRDWFVEPDGRVPSGQPR